MKNVTNKIKALSLNPLEIGSICNKKPPFDCKEYKSLNPLEIGSICNEFEMKNAASKIKVSIPLKSGLFVILLFCKGI